MVNNPINNANIPNNLNPFGVSSNLNLNQTPSNIPSGNTSADPNNDTSKVANLYSDIGDTNLDQFSTLKTIVDGNTNVFRYGLVAFEKDADNLEYYASQYDDPTMLGFTVDIDIENSPLFNEVEPFLIKYSENNVELGERLNIYANFKALVLQIFKSQESIINPVDKNIYIKSHYINEISGLNNLAKKQTKYLDDKLTFELYEDINLSSTALATMYNNLIYSYDTGRMMLPYNLTKFVLHIKISEIRNFTSLIGLQSTNINNKINARNLKFNGASVIYTLYDCDFDFLNSLPFGESIRQSGLGTGLVPYSTIKFDITYKSISRTYKSINLQTLTKKTLSDDNILLRDLSGDFQFGNYVDKKASNYFTRFLESDTVVYERNIDIINKQKQEFILQNSAISTPNYTNNPNAGADDDGIGDNLYTSGSLLTDTKNKLKKNIKLFLNTRLKEETDKLKRKQSELLLQFIYESNRVLNIKKIIPANVYDEPNRSRDIAEGLLGTTGISIENELIELTNKFIK